MWRIVPAVTLVLGVLTTVVVIGTAGGLTVVFVLLTPLVGWSFTIAGMVVWARRPRLRTGPLMAAAGLAWFVHLLTWTHAAPWALMGQALNNLYVALVGHLLLAYPTGRLRTRPLRALVALGYADVLGVHAARTLLPPGPVATMLATVELAVGLGLLVAGAAVLAGWWRPRPGRTARDAVPSAGRGLGGRGPGRQHAQRLARARLAVAAVRAVHRGPGGRSARVPGRPARPAAAPGRGGRPPHGQRPGRAPRRGSGPGASRPVAAGRLSGDRPGPFRRRSGPSGGHARGGRSPDRISGTARRRRHRSRHPRPGAAGRARTPRRGGRRQA